MTERTASAEHRLRAAGLRVTAPRIAVLHVLDKLGAQVTAEQVHIACAVGEAVCLTPTALPPGYAVVEAEVTYWGTCSDCVEPAPAIEQTSPERARAKS